MQYPFYEVTAAMDFSYNVIPLPISLKHNSQPCIMFHGDSTPVLTITPPLETAPIGSISLVNALDKYRQGTELSWDKKLMRKCDAYFEQVFLTLSDSVTDPEEIKKLISLSENKNTIRRLNERKQQLKQMHNAAGVIQTHFKNAISNPNYELCHRRLLREYSDLIIL